MSVYPRLIVRVVAIASILALTSSGMAIPNASAQFAPEWGAPGGPIADCTATSQLIDRLRAGLPQQKEWIRRTEEQLKAAEKGNDEATQEMKMAAVKAVKDLAKDMMQSAKLLQLRANNLRNLSPEQVKEWNDQFQHVFDIGEKWESAPQTLLASLKFGDELRSDLLDINKTLNFLQDSGLSDEAAKLAARYSAGVLGEAAVRGALVVRDVLFAGKSMHMTAREAEAARQNLADMRNAVANVESQIASHQEVYKSLCAPKMQTQTQQSPKPIPTADMAPPPAPPTPTAEPKGANGSTGPGGGGMGVGSVVGYAAGGTAAIVGAKYLSDYAKKAQCNQYETEMNTKMNSVVNAANNLIACGSSLSCVNSREASLNSALSSMLATAGNWCTCLGPDAATELSPEDKAMVRDLFNDLRGAGINPGSLPACFR